jgi:hypothetical protein
MMAKNSTNDDSLWRVLVEEWSFPHNLALAWDANGIAKILIDLEKEGFKISEGYPLLLVNHSDPGLVGYANERNYYGISAVLTPGHLPCLGGSAPAVGAPLPVDVATSPPNALLSFM